MKLLDRYVLSIFLPALGMFTLAFVFLYLAVDFASKLGKFLALKTIPMVPFIAHYYGVRLPMMLTYLLPTVFLFAPMFTVIKLARTNEILPIAASGTSLRRMSLPFLIAALLAGLAIAAMDEYVLSRVGDEINDTEAVLHVREVKHGVEDYDGKCKIWAGRYIAAQKEMVDQVRITRLDDTSKPIEVVIASRCFWDSSRKKWIAVDGWIEYPEELIRKEGQKPVVRREPIPPEGYVVHGSFKPETLQRSSFVSQLPFGRMRQLREDARKYPHVPSMWMKVYGRIAFPFSPIVLLLMGLPFVVAAHSKSFIKGLLFCFLLALGFYLTHFACMDLGNRGSLPPLGAAFGPTAVFGLLGVISFTRMRT